MRRETFLSCLFFWFFAIISVDVQAQEAGSLWELPVSEHWSGNTAEGTTGYCQESSIRWDLPLVADINLDGINDFVMPISCYQGSAEPGTKHNTPAWSAWRAYCSASIGGHEDCTETVFGSNEILTTGSIPTDLEMRPPGGGNPYIHVAEEPRDINGDGYPDFWFAQNRDDGREGLDYEEDAALLTEFCGERPMEYPERYEWDCTRKSVQSFLISRQDGTYEVVELPWGEVNAQAMLVLPNIIGTFDAWSMIYGSHKVARYNAAERSFVDVTSEFEALPNWGVVTWGNPYAKSFEHDGDHYVARADIHESIVTAPAPREVLSSHGFTLWRYDPFAEAPENRFTVSDTYTPPAAALFDYRVQQGGNIANKKGYVLRGLPTFDPRWHFFDVAVLDNTGEAILIVETESFTQVGDAYGAPINPSTVYEQGSFEAGSTANRYYPADPIQSFYLRDGKLTERATPVVEGETIFGESWKRFWDINQDGFKDLVAVSGGATRPAVFLNDGKGTMKRLFLGDVWPDLWNDPEFWNVSDWRGYGYKAALLPLSGSSTRLDLLYFSLGFGWPGIPDSLGDDFEYIAGDISIIRGNASIDTLPYYSVLRQQRNLEECLANGYWVTDGKQEQCNFGLPATAPDDPVIAVLDASGGNIIVLFSGYDGGSDVLSYTLQCTSSSGTTFTVTNDSATVTLSGLAQTDSYHCSGFVSNAVGTSGITQLASAIDFYDSSGLPIWLLYEATKRGPR